MQYVIIDNRTNTVLDLVEWDGEAPAPERAIDTSMSPVPAGATPAIGDTWDGTAFHTPPAPPEPPIGEAAADEPARDAQGDLVDP